MQFLHQKIQVSEITHIQGQRVFLILQPWGHGDLSSISNSQGGYPQHTLCADPPLSRNTSMTSKQQVTATGHFYLINTKGTPAHT